jgi:hypothetical protein
MRPKVAVVVLSGVLVCMFSVVWSQNSNTVTNSNAAVPNFNRANWNGRRLANGGIWNAEVEWRRNFDGNTGRQINNGSWNTNDGHWDYAEKGNTINALNRAVNAARPARKKPVRKKTRRPSAGMGGTLILGNTWSAMLVAGVS